MPPRPKKSATGPRRTLGAAAKTAPKSSPLDPPAEAVKEVQKEKLDDKKMVEEVNGAVDLKGVGIVEECGLLDLIVGGLRSGFWIWGLFEMMDDDVVDEVIGEYHGPSSDGCVNPDFDTAVVANEDDEVKDTVDEYENGERLDLEDNEPEYEPEEYGGEYYDEKEGEEEYIEVEEDEELEELEEGDVVEDEEGDEAEGVEEEDMADAPEEQDDHGVEEQEHAELVDAVEEEEHHEVVKERRKRKEYEVFVGGLDKDATEEDLRGIFNKVGEIVEVRLMRNPQTKKNKGFAFLRFATIEQAKRAVSELKNPVVNGKTCGVTPSQDSDTLFLGNICKTWTKEALAKKLKLYGIENIEDLTLVEDSNNEGTNRGFSFLEFSSRTEAMDAFKRLQKRDVVFGVDRPAKVSFADSFIDPGDEVMSQVKTIFVDGIPATWDEDRVCSILKGYGRIEMIELARNMPSARRNDFGFVTFDTHEAAVTCAKSINNAELGEGDAKVKVRARLSRPRQRTKGRRPVRADHRSGRPAGQTSRTPWNSPLPRPLPSRSRRVVKSRTRPAADRGLRRHAPVGSNNRRLAMDMPTRARVMPPPARSHERRVPVPVYPKSSSKRDYLRRQEPPPRSSVPASYSTRGAVERRPSYRDDNSIRAPAYPEVHRSNAPRPPSRRPYPDDGYEPRYERPPLVYHEGRPRDYESLTGSKRPYSAVSTRLKDEGAPRYADPAPRHSRARMDYEIAGRTSQYGDAYGDRLGRSSIGYSSRSSGSNHDSHSIYSSRQGMSYAGGSSSYGGSDGSVYSSHYGGDYGSRGSDVGGSSYSALYSSRSLGSSGSYMESGASGSYY
ncbi:Heterogeneous nuclear ribonucleoprotein Q-like protein [Drosera capensis]